jgi:hypothetical protein
MCIFTPVPYTNLIKSNLITSNSIICNKSVLLQESIFFLIHLFARDVLVMKKLEIKKTKPTFTITVLKIEYYAVLVSSISNLFTDKTSLANKWMSFSSSNSALSTSIDLPL